MKLTIKQQEMLDGAEGKATRKAMEILATLGEIYGAERMIPVTSVQIAGVSYANLGEAGLKFLTEMADGGGKTRVLTTLNPAGMDIENRELLGISEEFAVNQMRVLNAFSRMNVINTCSCTPYLFGNAPHFGEHIAWAESSAVCYANSVVGAKTNREGGPSALAAALTGFTPEYGYHLPQNRKPNVTVNVQAGLANNTDFGALGKAISQKANLEDGVKPIPFIYGIESATVEDLKSMCASIATFGGVALFHMDGVTPEAAQMTPPEYAIVITQDDIEAAKAQMTDAVSEDEAVDFVTLGCPHLSIKEIARVAELVAGKKVKKEFWLTTARPVKQIADTMGYTKIIEESGAKFAADTCCVVAPIKQRFKVMVTDSAKACYYAGAKNKFKTIIKPFDEVVAEALR